MLVLSRKPKESIVLGDTITLVVLEVRGQTVRLGIEAPKDVPVRRSELPTLPPSEREKKPEAKKPHRTKRKRA